MLNAKKKKNLKKGKKGDKEGQNNRPWVFF